tara:strand:+ start:19617 stop:20177 length:561 start_codon:yes stop_codon:yes gene_type:complete
MQTDEELMRAYKAGDETALRDLYERYQPLLVRVLGRDLDQVSEAQDLVQLTFLQLHRARNDFREGSKLRPWLMTIALNLKRQHFRRRRRRPVEDTSPGLAESTASRATQEALTDATSLRSALRSLRSKERTVMILYWFEGFTFPEISEIVGAKVSAVKVRAHRGKQHLREILGTDVTETAIRHSHK